MGQQTSKMKLAGFLYPTGYHVAAWRHPDAVINAGINFDHYADLAKTAEQGKLDFIFLADSVAIRGTDLPALSRTAIRYISQFEPLTLLSALSSVTKNIGLVASATTTYNEPFHIARKFASLDHLSSGRAGWNLITSQNEDEAYNFGFDKHPDHATRYLRAKEFAYIVKGLWNSWEDDAFLCDKEAGIFFDPLKVHTLNHEGEYYSVRGPLNVPRSPQGHPLIVQAGSSEQGMDLAAEIGELIFTAQQNIEDARIFFKTIKERLSLNNRAADELLVMPGIFPYVGRTEQEAIDKFEGLQALIDPVVGLSLLNGILGVDLSPYPLDSPLPAIPETNAGKSRQKLLLEMASRENMTIRQLYLSVSGSRGHWQIIGSAKQVADAMEEWFVTKAADGFCVMPPLLPNGLRDFVSLVVPELQRRGLFRSEYEGKTLRENLGLLRPPHPKSGVYDKIV